MAEKFQQPEYETAGDTERNAQRDTIERHSTDSLGLFADEATNDTTDDGAHRSSKGCAQGGSSDHPYGGRGISRRLGSIR